MESLVRLSGSFSPARHAESGESHGLAMERWNHAFDAVAVEDQSRGQEPYGSPTRTTSSPDLQSSASGVLPDPRVGVDDEPSLAPGSCEQGE